MRKVLRIALVVVGLSVATPGVAGAEPPGVRFVRPDPVADPSPVKVVRAEVAEITVEGERLAAFLARPARPRQPSTTYVLDEPRAVASRIVVSSDVPVEVPVLAPDDVRLDSFAFEVVDAETDKAIPGAELHLFPMSAEARILAADERGRIVLKDGASPKEPGLRLIARLAGSGSCVRAVGYRTRRFRGWAPFAQGVPASSAVEADVLIAVARREPIRVALHRIEESVSERPARLVDALGVPLAGAGVLAFGALPKPNPLGATPWVNGMAITDAAGKVFVPRSPALCVDVRLRGVPVAVFVVDTRGDAALDLRLPPIAEVTVALGGIPGVGGHWVLNRLGPNLVPEDGPLLPPIYGPGVEAALAAEGSAVPTIEQDGAGNLGAGRAEIRIPVPVGVTRTLWLGEGPWPSRDDAPPGSRRTLELRAAAPGAMRIERTWSSLSLAK